MPATKRPAPDAAPTTSDETDAPPAKTPGKQLQRKKLDARVTALIKNGVQTRHRSMFVVVGDRGRDQVVNLHYLLSKTRTTRPSVLWCYKKELDFTTHRKKRMKQLKKLIQRGIRDADEEDPFELFVSSTNIRYTYYKETQKVLGQTFGMCVLQDFEALTPNLLARTVETVEGGGAVVLLLRNLQSLRQLYTMAMDVHARYRTESHHDIVARFNERFLLSLGNCASCLVVDDELNVLPLSAGRQVQPLPAAPEPALELPAVSAEPPAGPLVKLARTSDQAQAVLSFIDAITAKTLLGTVSLTAARGRGKSAALGLALAAAVHLGYANIFLTSPSPENLKTLFDFAVRGLQALGYEEHLDYGAVQSADPEFNKAIVRLNIFRQHRQTIQYIPPQDAHHLAQAELLVIDEAAAIPLPLVRSLLGNYLVFMASTINGYEGTGRSLSLKLLQQLRQGSAAASGDGVKSARTLKEIKLETPIRYAPGDGIETWLNGLLCLDCNSLAPRHTPLTFQAPFPRDCELFHIDRDALFSYHPVSEAFLRRLMALYVAGHYKNTPNDLQLISDAPQHELFVLLAPEKAAADEGERVLPEPLCVVQVCFEGRISRQTVANALSRGRRADGDLIPWCMATQFQDQDFAQLSGARIVRIATHPDYLGMGYGSRAMELLVEYFSGNMVSVDEGSAAPVLPKRQAPEETLGDLHTENIAVKSANELPPLLTRVAERALAERLHWLGVSFGLTGSLAKFWKRLSFAPVYLRQTASELTGEHTVIMLRRVGAVDETVQQEWLGLFARDFGRRLVRLLGFQFRAFHPVLCLSLLEGVERAAAAAVERRDQLPLAQRLRLAFSPWDLKRLETYGDNMSDYHVVMDLAPVLAEHYFGGGFRSLSSENADETAPRLAPVQAAVLLGVGLQRKTMDELAVDLQLPVSQLLALFVKLVKRLGDYIQSVLRDEVAAAEPAPEAPAAPAAPVATTLSAELEGAAGAAAAEVRARQDALIGGLDMSQYAVGGSDADWAQVSSHALSSQSGLVSVANAASAKVKSRDAALGFASQLASSGKASSGKSSSKKSSSGKAKKHKSR